MSNEIQAQLFSMQDIDYRAFVSKLIPNIDERTIIGVRIPLLRKLAKSMKHNCSEFLRQTPHYYHEENLLHALIVSDIRDFSSCIEEADRFLPFVTNWAVCDSFRPICFRRNKAALLPHIERWLQLSDCYTVRFAIEMLMLHYLDEDFAPRFLQTVAAIESSEYYVQMMIAWYFAEALAKQYESAVKYLEAGLLPPQVHQKTIQKAVESYKIQDTRKAELRKLRRKQG